MGGGVTGGRAFFATAGVGFGAGLGYEKSFYKAQTNKFCWVLLWKIEFHCRFRVVIAFFRSILFGYNLRNLSTEISLRCNGWKCHWSFRCSTRKKLVTIG